jgi:hypothetical protein
LWWNCWKLLLLLLLLLLRSRAGTGGAIVACGSSLLLTSPPVPFKSLLQLGWLMTTLRQHLQVLDRWRYLEIPTLFGAVTKALGDNS